MKGSWLKSTLREGFQWKAALFYANNSSQSTGKCLQTNLIIRERNQIFLRPLETQSDQTKIIRVLLLILERCECMLVLKRGKIPISRIHLGAADKMLKCHSSPSSNGITSLIPNSVQSPVLRLWPSASQLSITFAKVWDKQCPGLTHILLLLVVKSGKYCDTHSLRFPSVLLNFLSGLIWESVTSYIIQQSQIWRSKGLGFSKITTTSILLLDICNLIWLPCLHRQKLMYL